MSITVKKNLSSLQRFLLGAFLSTLFFATGQPLEGKELITFKALKENQMSIYLQWESPKKHTLQIRLLQIPRTKEIINLEEEYLKKVYAQHYQKELHLVQPTMAVIHSIALGTLEAAIVESGFLNSHVLWGISKWGNLQVGAHFIIDKDGAIYALIPIEHKKGKIEPKLYLKRHVKEANPFAIGIENVLPRAPKNWPKLPKKEKDRVFSQLTKKQIQANAKLLCWLSQIHPQMTHIFSHHQFTNPAFRNKLKTNKKLLPIPFNKNYTTQGKHDIGNLALEEIRKEAKKMGVEFH